MKANPVSILLQHVSGSNTHPWRSTGEAAEDMRIGARDDPENQCVQAENDIVDADDRARPENIVAQKSSMFDEKERDRDEERKEDGGHRHPVLDDKDKSE